MNWTTSSAWRHNNITKTKTEAICSLEQYRREVISRQSSFAEPAKKVPDCEVGPFCRIDLYEEFTESAFALEAGEIIPIVDTPSGIHIIISRILDYKDSIVQQNTYVKRK